MQLSSSMTIMPPEPIIEPTFFSSSKSTGMPRYRAGMHPPLGPPVWTALNSLPSGTPPPMSKMISRSVMPMGTSTSPVLLTLPTRLKTLVPFEPSVPMEANQSAPRSMMAGTLAQVSTLLSVVGLSQRPLSTVWVCFARGSPTLPSRDAIRAVDSPHTNAPPPRTMPISKLCPLPRMFSPSKPMSLACPSAVRSVRTASGYSCRT